MLMTEDDNLRQTTACNKSDLPIRKLHFHTSSNGGLLVHKCEDAKTMRFLRYFYPQPQKPYVLISQSEGIRWGHQGASGGIRYPFPKASGASGSMPANRKRGKTHVLEGIRTGANYGFKILKGHRDVVTMWNGVCLGVQNCILEFYKALSWLVLG